MSLEKQINEDIKSAMIARDTAKLEALRAIKSSLLIIKTGKDASGGEIPETVEISLLQKLVKQRKESAAIYQEKDRTEMAEVELFQAAIIEKYLPEQMSEDDVEKIVVDIIQKVGASSMKDMGKVMGLVSKELAGKAESKIIAQIIKKSLGV